MDMAFNNAGIAGPSGKFTDETPQEFDSVNGVNLRGVWACMKHEVLQMCKSTAGFDDDQRDKTLKSNVPPGSRARADLHSRTPSALVTPALGLPTTAR
ncbi:MAG: hypothetical protein ACRYHQ_07870 [Janthinobacterium lividum]